MQLILAVFVTHAGIAASVGWAFSRACLSVRTLTGKRLELSTPKLVHVYSISVAQRALTHKSKGQRSRSHGYKNLTVASDYGQYSVHLYAAVLPAAVAGVGLHFDTAAYFF